MCQNVTGQVINTATEWNNCEVLIGVTPICNHVGAMDILYCSRVAEKNIKQDKKRRQADTEEKSV